MDKRYYTAASLRAVLREYEQRYGVPTANLVAAYRMGTLPDGVSSFDAFEWAATSAELGRLCGRREHQPA